MPLLLDGPPAVSKVRMRRGAGQKSSEIPRHNRPRSLAPRLRSTGPTSVSSWPSTRDSFRPPIEWVGPALTPGEAPGGLGGRPTPTGFRSAIRFTTTTPSQITAQASFTSQSEAFSPLKIAHVFCALIFLSSPRRYAPGVIPIASFSSSVPSDDS